MDKLAVFIDAVIEKRAQERAVEMLQELQKRARAQVLLSELLKLAGPNKKVEMSGDVRRKPQSHDFRKKERYSDPVSASPGYKGNMFREMLGDSDLFYDNAENKPGPELIEFLSRMMDQGDKSLI